MEIQPMPKFVQMFRSWNGIDKLKKDCPFCELQLSDILNSSKHELQMFAIHLLLQHREEALYLDDIDRWELR